MDAVCRSAVVRGNLAGALTEPGRARAHSGAGLDETLHDVAALHAVPENGSDTDGLISANPGAVPPAMLRTATAGWTDASSPRARPALLMIGIELSHIARRYRPMAIVLVADVVRDVSDDGDTAAVLDDSTAAVLAKPDADFEHRIRHTRHRIADRLTGDPQLAATAGQSQIPSPARHRGPGRRPAAQRRRQP
ncbi:hypothetical protein [Amycolatopsis sp. SID8362]|uniref:hypothetical protein n=1 Tax=Amycolatopsis sp. SID8362 TaxID=2690346 RepID=UPI00136C9766|nr:hypothetical protein [Amycolatopsis sp. SID8362]NBH03343.1 hypothetical protein [Amycolatopsis sp. SID8362]NED40044.1 hypothetical protein [Amycolatopsis sp. SID8362]